MHYENLIAGGKNPTKLQVMTEVPLQALKMWQTHSGAFAKRPNTFNLIHLSMYTYSTSMILLTAHAVRCGSNGKFLGLSAILHGTSKAISFRERHLHALKVRVIGELPEAKRSRE